MKKAVETAEAREDDLARGLGALLHPTPTLIACRNPSTVAIVLSLCVGTESSGRLQSKLFILVTVGEGEGDLLTSPVGPSE